MAVKLRYDRHHLFGIDLWKTKGYASGSEFNSDPGLSGKQVYPFLPYLAKSWYIETDLP